jgi:DNA-binding response OmpR family regulator
MSQTARLLVVDDEVVVCESCRRIFAAQGYLVDKTTNPVEGLELALKRDYAVVLLDIRMPAMDGIEFLRRLRCHKTDLPVLLITGYPSFSSAQAAVRLGAADYITKPFTPEELVQAVRRLVDLAGGPSTEPAERVSAKPQSWRLAARQARFFEESWWAGNSEHTVFVGAVFPSALMSVVDQIKLPVPGERVFRGLPLAGLMCYGKCVRMARWPVSGVVTAVNQELDHDLAPLWESPLEAGWIAQVQPSSLEIDQLRSRPRRVILASAGGDSAQQQTATLARLGCEVSVASNWDQLEPLLPEAAGGMLLVDAVSLGQTGLELVKAAERCAADLKTVVLGSSPETEKAYRQCGIFYYAVEPFADREILDILDAVFCRPVCVDEQALTGAEHPVVTSLIAADKQGRQFGLLLSGSALSARDGLGWFIRNELHNRMWAVKAESHPGAITAARLIALASMCEHLLVVVAREVGRLPGALVVDEQHRLFALPPEIAQRATTLIVQPAAAGKGLAGFDQGTASALAEHIADLLSARTLHG